MDSKLGIRKIDDFDKAAEEMWSSENVNRISHDNSNTQYVQKAEFYAQKRESESKVDRHGLSMEFSI